MAGVVSPAFLATTLGAALALRLLGRRVPRDVIFIVASAAFVFAIAGDPVATIPFWALVFGGFTVVQLARRAAALPALLLLVAAVVLSWWWLRERAPGALGVMPGGAAVFGLSYAMFRIVHLAIDARDDELGRPLTLRNYLCYLTFFPSYLAGPIQRYQDFSVQLASSPSKSGTALWLPAAARAIAGIFKCTALAGGALVIHVASLVLAQADPGGLRGAAFLAAAALGFAAYLYFSFTGYMDVVIAAARVLGMEIPENFDHPLRSRNFLDVWSRWHITLSEWFKFYVFNPSLKAMLESFTRPALAPWLAAAAFFLTFFLMGIWHGRTPALIVYGLVLGGGVSVNKLYQVWSVKRLGRKAHAALAARPRYQVLAQALALGYFVLALSFLWKVTPDALAAGGVQQVGAALIVFVACALLAVLTRAFPERPKPPSGGIAGAIVAGQLACAGAYLWLTQGAVPDLIYQWL